jgi:hypothetical protein
MADRIPTYIDQSTQRITELAVDDTLDVAGVKATDVDVTNLTIGGDAYAPYDDAQLQADVATKLDADKIWTGTQDEYDDLSPDADTLYFIV